MEILSVGIVLLGTALVLGPVCVWAVIAGDRKVDKQIKKS